MFAAIFNGDRRPIDVGPLAAPSCRVDVVGGARHVALLLGREGGPRDSETHYAASPSGRRWLLGRLRLDARTELADRLAAPPSAARSDGELCLQAYEAWGDGFVERLAGDFCFCLWDDDRGRLICARDQLGVRSLFYTQTANQWLVSDSLGWLAARLPGRQLDDVWVADFLASGASLDVERTIWRDIARLPPAHLMSVAEDAAERRRYWQLVVDSPIHHRRRQTYTEQFRALVERAIGDRLPTGQVGVSMSGGIDSTALAACAVAATGDPSRVVAECVYFQSLIADDEQIFAGLAARHMGIDLHLAALDQAAYDPQWRERTIITDEPTTGIVTAHPDREMNRAMAERAEVWFYGEGPDNALEFERAAYLSWLRRRGDWLRLASAAWSYAHAKGAAGWRDILRRALARPPRHPSNDLVVPRWMHRDMVRRTELEQRLERETRDGEQEHAWHPRAVASFGNPIWQRLFTSCDFDEAQAPLVWRHPYLDLRVLTFMLSVPPIPWAYDKRLLREAMKGRLPDAVLERRKKPLSGNPLATALHGQALPELRCAGQLSRWLAVDALPGREVAETDLDALITVHALDHWLAVEATGRPVAAPGTGR